MPVAAHPLAAPTAAADTMFSAGRYPGACRWQAMPKTSPSNPQMTGICLYILSGATDLYPCAASRHKTVIAGAAVMDSNNSFIPVHFSFFVDRQPFDTSEQELEPILFDEAGHGNLLLSNFSPEGAGRPPPGGLPGSIFRWILEFGSQL